MSRNPEFGDSVRPLSSDSVAHDAAEWVARRDRGLTPEEVVALAEWMDADDRHAAEFTRISRSWQKLDNIGAAPELAAMADEVEARAKARRARRPIWAVAVGFAAVMGIFVLWKASQVASSPGPMKAATESYIVLPSTARSMALPDGSVAKLNGDSRIETDFTSAERRVRLMQGEAHFIVAKDAARPFIVSAGSIKVRATGTAFNVRLAADFVEVLVTEGKVQLGNPAYASEQPLRHDESPNLAAPERALIAGERAVVQTAASVKIPVTLDTPSQKEIAQMLAWQGTQLVFNRTPLDQVTSAFNRYNARQLVLADPALRNRTLSGVFRADNLDGFIQLLSASVDVTTEPQGTDRILLRAAP
ncbi:MAG: FecR domain-containing protein [Opitutaceae bacterium]|jgi:transmembrane sensor